MSNSAKDAIEFWFEFDDFFLFHSSAEIRQAMQTTNPYGRLVDLFYFHQRNGTLDTDFKKSIEGIKDSIRLLADNIVKLMDKYFKGDTVAEQNAFEMFAQGLLLDNGLDANGQPRRPEGDKIHMMDSGTEGFVVFHAFTRAVVLLDLTENKDRWLQIDRHIALAGAILASLIKSGKGPEQSEDPNHNTPIEPTQLAELRQIWLNLKFEDIDKKIVQLQEQVMSKHSL